MYNVSYIKFSFLNYLLNRRPHHIMRIVFCYCHRYVSLLPFDYRDNKLGVDTYLDSFIFSSPLVDLVRVFVFLNAPNNPLQVTFQRSQYP